MKKQFLLTLALLFAISARAEITLVPLFSDNMMLQQQSQAPIWGVTTIKNGEVRVTTSWDNQTFSTKADSKGNWRVSVETPVYGGPYTITIEDGDQQRVISNVIIGEVWIAAGQSNMFRKVSGQRSQHVIDSNMDLARSRDPQMRIMTIGRIISDEPLTTLRSGGWSEATSGVVSSTSATAYYFARTMRECLDVPVGIIVAAVGGTSINCWMDSQTASKFEDIAWNDAENTIDYRHSCRLYNGMINPIAGYAAKGFIWYQGESDIVYYQSYAQKMADMVAQWRQKWDNEDMPFYYAQIAPYEYELYIRAGWHSMYTREAQLEAAELIPNSGMAPLSDVGEADDIHPSNKRVPGERLALQALEKSYGFEGVEADGPTLESVEVNGNEMTLTFANARFGVSTLDQGELRDFEIAGQDGHFVEATAKIVAGNVVVSAPSVKEPKDVRYGFKNWFVGTLYNIEGIPASSFRTDKY